MQEPLLPSASTALQQLILVYLQQQQQQQQQEIVDAAAAAAYLLPQSQLPLCSTATAVQSIRQQQALHHEPAAEAQLQSQSVPPGLLGSNPLLAALNDVVAAAATAGAVAPFSPPGHWQQQQLLQWQVTAGHALNPASTQQQLQSLTHSQQPSLGCLGSTGAASIPSYIPSSSVQASPSGFPTPLSSYFSSSSNSCSTAGTAATLDLHTAAAAPALLDLSLLSLGLTDGHTNGSVGSNSPKRISSSQFYSSGNLFSSSNSSSPTTDSWTGKAPAVAAAIAATPWGSSSSSVGVSAQQLLHGGDEGPLVHHHFCRQEISVSLDAAVTVLLNTLRSQQYATENPYPRQHRLYVCGLRESCKAIKCGVALAVLLAPDIQLGDSPKYSKPDRVLDGRMREIVMSSQVPQVGRARVPVVFALSRQKIGQVFGSKKRMSAITLLDVAGVEVLFDVVLQLAQEGRQRWMAADAGYRSF